MRLFLFRKNIKITKLILAFCFLALLILNLFYKQAFLNKGFILSAFQLLDLGIFFIAGSLLAVFKFENNKYLNLIGILSFAVLILSVIIGYYDNVRYIVLPLVILCFGLKSTPIINSIGRKIGDLSYGVYIYGFPIQQSLYYYFKFNYIQLMVYGLLLSILMGYISWHLIEKKALKFKRLKF